MVLQERPARAAVYGTMAGTMARSLRGLLPWSLSSAQISLRVESASGGVYHVSFQQPDCSGHRCRWKALLPPTASGSGVHNISIVMVVRALSCRRCTTWSLETCGCARASRICGYQSLTPSNAMRRSLPQGTAAMTISASCAATRATAPFYPSELERCRRLRRRSCERDEGLWIGDRRPTTAVVARLLRSLLVLCPGAHRQPARGGS